MTSDPRSTGAEGNDDAAIAKLVHDVAETWSMPAVRLDAPGWRDRVRSPRARRVAGLRAWLRRAGRAGTAAVALTVAGALIAVIVTRPTAQPGKSGDPSSGPSARPSGPPVAEETPLPKLLVNGETPQPASIVVMREQGDFAQVDLENGTVGGALANSDYGSAVWQGADGSIVCLCLKESANVDTMPTVDEVRLDRFDPAGNRVSSTPVERFTGAADPRDVGTFIPERAPHVLTKLSFSDDGRYGFVGWSLRDAPVWRSGIAVVDVSDGSVVSRLTLPGVGTGDGDARRVVDAPRVIGSTRFLRLLIARPWFRWQPVTSENAVYDFGFDVFAAGFEAGDLTGAAPVAGADGCGHFVLRGGPRPDGGTWLACAHGLRAETVVRRIAADGKVLGDTRIAGAEGIEGELLTTSPDGAVVYVWNPATATLTSVDVATGAMVTGTGPTAAGTATGPLAALGHWLAPTVAAKSFLLGAVIVSPDGSRVYAIGVRGTSTGPESSGSTGVFVFDAASLELIDHWPPTADFVSLALSGDGRFAYAAGLSGVNAAGESLPQQSSSITVFDTADGSVRLVAGELGGGLITFTAPTFE